MQSGRQWSTTAINMKIVDNSQATRLTGIPICDEYKTGMAVEDTDLQPHQRRRTITECHMRRKCLLN